MADTRTMNGHLTPADSIALNPAITRLALTPFRLGALGIVLMASLLIGALLG